MMKTRIEVILLTGLLLAATLSVASWDRAASAGPDYERVEIPAAGLAVSFPSDWSINMKMEADDTRLPVGLVDPAGAQAWDLLSAVSGWAMLSCTVTWFEGMPVSAETHASLVAEGLSSDANATVEVTSVDLPAGVATRVLYRTSDGGALADGYMLGVGADHYYLSCLDMSPFEDDLLPIAESIELLSEDGIVEPEPDPSDQPDPEPEVAFSIGGYDLGSFDIPDAGISMLLPLGWELDFRMERKEFTLPPEYADAEPAYFSNVFYIESEAGDWCGLQVHEDNPLALEEHAEWREAYFADGAPEGLMVDGTYTLLDGDLAHRIDVSSDDDPGVSRSYILEKDGVRLSFLCGSDAGANPAWQAMVESVRPLGDEPVVEPEPTPSDPGRVEVPAAGVAISFPPTWDVDAETEEVDFAVPSESREMARATRYAAAYPAGAWCAAYRFDDHPLYLEDHAAWAEQLAINNADDPATTTVMPVVLPVADAIRVIETHESGRVNAAYLFDLDGYRHLFVCGSQSPPDDAWLSVAETIEALALEPAGEVPPGVPDEAVAWSDAGPFVGTIPVDETRVMRASCEQALWIEFPDGTFEERVECVLGDDPVEATESQGVVPAETVTIEGGACEWVSDFWLATDGSETWADSWSVTVEPDGTAVATSAYGVEMLDCADD